MIWSLVIRTTYDLSQLIYTAINWLVSKGLMHFIFPAFGRNNEISEQKPVTEQTFNCSKSTTQTPGKYVKNKSDVINVAQHSLLLTLNIFYIILLCFSVFPIIVFHFLLMNFNRLIIARKFLKRKWAQEKYKTEKFCS